MDSIVRKVYYNQNNSGQITLPKAWLDEEKQPQYIILTRFKDGLVMMENFRGVNHDDSQS